MTIFKHEQGHASRSQGQNMVSGLFFFSNRESSAMVSLGSDSGASKTCQMERPESTQFLAAAQIKHVWL